MLQRLAADGVDALRPIADAPDLAGYLERALRGGLPEVALASSPGLQRRGLAAYVDNVVTRDAALALGSRDPVRLRRYLQAWAANLACVVDHATLIEAAQINRMTALAYDSLLTALLVVDPLPAWRSGRLKRLTGRPKRHLVEPAPVGPLLGVNLAGVLRDPRLLGRVLEGFVLAELRPELASFDYPPALFHLRDRDGRHEVDLLVEYPDGRVVAIEVKAGAAVGSSRRWGSSRGPCRCARPITEAKNGLSALIDHVRAGETVLILDRGVPVARLESAVGLGGDAGGRIERLARAGAVRAAGVAVPEAVWASDPPRARSGGGAVAALLEERRGGR